MRENHQKTDNLHALLPTNTLEKLAAAMPGSQVAEFAQQQLAERTRQATPDEPEQG